MWKWHLRTCIDSTATLLLGDVWQSETSAAGTVVRIEYISRDQILNTGHLLPLREWAVGAAARNTGSAPSAPATTSRFLPGRPLAL
ncbi:hypothetical protein B296_00010637 [Ensete ventricosum]|uniref:Uncharacterized protein n=1 Tax=Ensete ventricosum TaxID=4639 RepID=A0A426Z2Y8_ENSVE|nr:hypothetical protein B296_00010637 [Ensete ventricosum]